MPASTRRSCSCRATAPCCGSGARWSRCRAPTSRSSAPTPTRSGPAACTTRSSTGSTAGTPTRSCARSSTTSTRCASGWPDRWPRSPSSRTTQRSSPPPGPPDLFDPPGSARHLGSHARPAPDDEGDHVRTIQHWIDGAQTRGGSTRLSPVFNPATGEQQAELLLAEPGDVDRAVAAAAAAFEQWSESSLSRRSQVLFAFREIVNRRKDEIAAVITDEHGKVLSDAAGEVQRGLEVVEFACGIPQLLKGEYSDQVSTGVDSYSFRQPLGVV